jgi:hypothetical protein
MKNRGQFQILGAGFLILLMISVRFTVVREYAPSFRDTSADISLEKGELTRALLTSLADVSNVQRDPNADFNSTFQNVLGSLQANEFGLFLLVESSSASLSWPSQGEDGDGNSSATALVNVTATDLGSSWLFNGQASLSQSILTSQVTHDFPLLGLMHVEIPINLTSGNQAARWSASIVDYNGTSYQASLVKNYGNGEYVISVSIPYQGPGPYYLRVETWDVNDILVVAAFTLNA